MNIEDMTLGQLREIQSLLSAPASGTPETDALFAEWREIHDIELLESEVRKFERELTAERMRVVELEYRLAQHRVHTLVENENERH